ESGWKALDHSWEKCCQQCGEDPVRKAAESLAFCAIAIGKYFRDENPDHGSLSDGMGGDEGKDACRHDAVVSGKESPGNETERSDVAVRANKQKRAAPEPVDQPESDEGKDQIGQANANRLQQRGFGAESCEFEDARREVENRVDARKLVEESNQNG